MKIRLFALLLAVSTAAFAGDRDFDQIVKAIESHYGVKPTHIPFMGLASLVVKTTHPEGVSGFRIATFEHLEALGPDAPDFISALPLRDLHPLVRVYSRSGGESTYIYAGDFGKSTRLLITTLERSEATVVEVKVSIDVLLKALQDPSHMTDALGLDHVTSQDN
jgi:hypothetical protein